MFKGYFHGISDAENEATVKQQPRLHAVIISSDAFAIGKRISDIGLGQFSIEVKSVRRPSLQGLEIDQDDSLVEGDVIVLLGQASDLTKAQTALITGRAATS